LNIKTPFVTQNHNHDLILLVYDKFALNFVESLGVKITVVEIGTPDRRHKKGKKENKIETSGNSSNAFSTTVNVIERFLIKKH